MKKFLLSAVAAAAVFAAPAHALTVTNVGAANGVSNVYITTTDTPIFTNAPDVAGALKVTSDVGTFTAYCVELTESFGQLPGAYTSAATIAKEAELSKAVQWMLDNGTFFAPATTAASALNQAIIWEIVYEDSGNYNLGAGDFAISNSAVAANSTLSFDFSVLDSVVVRSEIDVLENAGNQNLLVVTAVPEPSTYALMLAGLAGVGFLARRRRAD